RQWCGPVAPILPAERPKWAEPSQASGRLFEESNPALLAIPVDGLAQAAVERHARAVFDLLARAVAVAGPGLAAQLAELVQGDHRNAPAQGSLDAGAEHRGVARHLGHRDDPRRPFPEGCRQSVAEPLIAVLLAIAQEVDALRRILRAQRFSPLGGSQNPFAQILHVHQGVVLGS